MKNYLKICFLLLFTTSSCQNQKSNKTNTPYVISFHKVDCVQGLKHISEEDWNEVAKILHKYDGWEIVSEDSFKNIYCHKYKK